MSRRATQHHAEATVIRLAPEPARPDQRIELPRIDLPDGGAAVLTGGALEVRDRDGLLRIRYADGEAEVSAPRDLRLTAPRGRVVIEAATDVVLSAARDVSHEAGRKLALSAGEQRVELDPVRARVSAARLEVAAKDASLCTGVATVVAKTLTTTAEALVSRAERHEISAGMLIERARNALCEISGVWEARLGRARALVAGALQIHSERTAMISKKETSIDGERILLG